MLETNKEIELFSLHSASKGVFGECGFRGGYLHCYGIDQGYKALLLKLAGMF